MKKRIKFISLLTAFVLLLSGAIALTAFATESGAPAEPSAKIAYCTLAHENNVYLQYAVKAENIENNFDVTLLLWSEDDHLAGKADPTATLLCGGTEEIEGEEHLVFEYTGLAAKQMTEWVYARVAIGGEVQEGLHKYSILQYAYNMLGKTGTATESESMKTLLSDMLAYGASAQTHFGYRTDRLAIDAFYQIKVENGKLTADGATYGLYLEGDEVDLTAAATDAEGAAFSHWADSAGTNLGSEISLTVTVGMKNEVYTAVYTSYSTGLKFTSNGDGTCHVSGIGTCTDTELRIPPVSPEGVQVTSIGYGAFSGCSSLTSIEIPNSVTSIDERAFNGCTDLIQIENGISYVDKWAIDCDTSVTSVILRSNTVGIGDYAFSGCSGLTSIEIPNSVTSIGDSVFSYCSGLTSIEMSNSVTSIGDSVFFCCSGLTSIEIPNSVTSIGHSVFFRCSGLTSIEIPNSVTSINSSAFQCCSSLTSITVAEGNNTYHANQNCLIKTASKTLILGCKNSIIPTDGSVTSIGASAFNGCSGLTSIEIPNSVTSIGASAFNGCSGLTSIEIPNSVTSISSDTFSNCSGLTSITIPDSVTSIEMSAFYHCDSLTTINIPNEVKGIGNCAFQFCYSLTSINIPNGVTSINYATFAGCDNLTSITIPNSVTSIDERAFDSCYSLTDINFTGTMAKWEAIWKGSDWNDDLDGYTIHCSDGDIVSYSKDLEFTSNGDGTCAVTGCYGHFDAGGILIPPVSPEGDIVTSIGDSAFNCCDSLKSITIPDSVTSIGDDAFSSCSSLTSITIPNSVTSIGNSAFSGCSSLTSIEIPNSVTSISHYAFKGCSSLTSITIPNGVTSIGRRAFCDCTSLTDITFLGTMAEWEAITKVDSWNTSTGTYTIHCIDGDIAKS